MQTEGRESVAQGEDCEQLTIYSYHDWQMELNAISSFKRNYALVKMENFPFPPAS